jgi:hypothetical protein
MSVEVVAGTPFRLGSSADCIIGLKDEGHGFRVLAKTER